MSRCHSSDADLEDAIRQAKRVLTDLRRQRTERMARSFLSILSRSVADGVEFYTSDLFDHARIDSDLRVWLVGFTPKQLGKYLQRLALHGPTENGLVLCRGKRSGEGCKWRLTLTLPDAP